MIRRALAFALGLAITAAALWYMATPDVMRELKTVIAKASWPGLVSALLIAAVVQWLRAWRFHIMTTGGLSLPRNTLVRISFQLNFLNFVLPFRLGELGYPVLMRRAYGQPLLSAAGVLLLARIFDLCTVGAIFLAMAAWLGLAPTQSVEALAWAAAALLASAPVALVFSAHAFSGWLARDERSERMPAAFRSACDALSARRAQLTAIGLSFAIWLVFGVLATLAANAVAAIPAAVALLGASAGNIAFALPINGIGGFGPSQAAWIVVVDQAGVAWTDAVISALAVYAVTLAGALLFGGAAMLASGGAARR